MDAYPSLVEVSSTKANTADVMALHLSTVLVFCLGAVED